MPTGSRKKRHNAHQPGHLPEWPVAADTYRRLYSFNFGVDDYLEETAEWQERRIPPGLPKEDVYRLLPSALDLEYGGYLTRTRIRYLPCQGSRAGTRMSQLCTFHNHPSDFPNADLPSASDVYSFLAFRHLRTVTVGATKIWVWDKTQETLTTVRKLASWSEGSLLKEARRLERRDPIGWHQLLIRSALKNLGLMWPKGQKTLQQHGPEMLERVLKFKVREFPRNP